MKLKSLKKPAALLLAMALSVSALTGCSGGTESSSGSSSSSGDATSSTVSTEETSGSALPFEETLTVTAGTINISESYEGLEALNIEIQGGDITLTASDDGLNAAGGVDSSGTTGGRDGMLRTRRDVLLFQWQHRYLRRKSLYKGFRRRDRCQRHASHFRRIYRRCRPDAGRYRNARL